MKDKTKKDIQLQMSHGKARNKLQKTILFNLVVDLNRNTCFQCGFPITQEADFSIEHKIPWLDSENPIELFFSLNNIAFSHLKCNFAASRKPWKKYFTKESRAEAYKEINRKAKKKGYTPEKRRAKYLKHGY